MAYPVKNFNSWMNGAPIINGTPGSLVAALRACLITGFGELTATSATIEAGVLKLTFADGKTFQKDTVVEISGADTAALNTEHWVEDSAAGVIYIKTDQTSATGNIKVKYAATGEWTMPYQATNKAAFKSAHPHGSKCYFLFDDTHARKTKVINYRDMSAIDKGDDPVPFGLLENTYFIKSHTANTQARLWWIVADGKTVYMVISPATNETTFAYAQYVQGMYMQSFGSYITEGFATKLNSFVQGLKLEDDTNIDQLIFRSPNIIGCPPCYWTGTMSAYHTYLAYDPVENKRGCRVWHTPERLAAAQGDSGTGMFTYSNIKDSSFNRPNNKIYLSDMLMLTMTDDVIGRYPGLLYVCNDLRKNISTILGKTVFGSDRFDGRKMLALPSTAELTQGNIVSTPRSVGAFLMDITGPWG